IELMPTIHSLPFLLPLAGRRRHRRNSPVGWLNVERCPPRLDNLGTAVPPKIVVGSTHVSFRGSVAAIFVVPFDDFLLVCRSFLLGEELLVGEVRRPFYRRNRCEAPRALQVGLPFGCTQ